MALHAVNFVGFKFSSYLERVAGSNQVFILIENRAAVSLR
jgi:hypothetical protein